MRGFPRLNWKQKDYNRKTSANQMSLKLLYNDTKIETDQKEG